MARIIYKEGLYGQNRLASIEGIEIELLNGQKALIYPKYAEKALLMQDKIASWDATETSEIEALKNEENLFPTYELLKCGSPAAKFVAQFRTDEHRLFVLPTLLAAVELYDKKRDIDALAKTIEEADLFQDFTSNIWSCSRCDDSSGWVAYDDDYYACDYKYLGNSNLVVPVLLYR